MSDEQKFYEDIRFILKQAREQVYNSANGIICFKIYDSFANSRRITKRIGKKSVDL